MSQKQNAPRWYDLLETLRVAGAVPSRMLFWGPPGVGKTSVGIECLGDSPYRRVAITDGMQADDLIGMFTLQSNVNGGTSTVWADGPVIAMMRIGGTLILDEIDQHGSGITATLHAVLDDNRILQLTLPTGEVVQAAPGFRAIATSNANPAALSTPLIDRFAGGLILHCDIPHPGAIAGLPSDAQTLLTTHYTRQAEAHWYAPLSVRSLRAVYGLLPVLGLQGAAIVVYGADAAPDVLASLATASD